MESGFGDRGLVSFFGSAEVFESGDDRFAVAPVGEVVADEVWGGFVAAEDEEFCVGVEFGAEKVDVAGAEADGFEVCCGPAEAGGGEGEGG